jgi:hypothetical protein
MYLRYTGTSGAMVSSNDDSANKCSSISEPVSRVSEAGIVWVMMRSDDKPVSIPIDFKRLALQLGQIEAKQLALSSPSVSMGDGIPLQG